MSYQTLEATARLGFLWVRLNRPNQRNSVNRVMLSELLACLQSAENDDAIKAVILEGSADWFCTGMDFQDALAGGAEQLLTDYFTLLRQIAEGRKLVIANVRGVTSAGGVGIVAACDLVIAHESATFALSELLFGLIPASVLPFLVRRVGHQRAKLLALSTLPIAAAQAHHWGLIDEVAPEPERVLRTYLRRWRRLSPTTVGTLKRYMNQIAPISAETETAAVETVLALMADADVTSGIERFVTEGVAPWTA